jgi:hypothetical protein
MGSQLGNTPFESTGTPPAPVWVTPIFELQRGRPKGCGLFLKHSEHLSVVLVVNKQHGTAIDALQQFLVGNDRFFGNDPIA